MSVSQNFIPVPEKKKLKADVNEHVMHELELYLQAAQEDYDWLTLDAVVEQLLGDALKKDRAFRSWLKKHKKKTEQQSQQTLSFEQNTPPAASHSRPSPVNNMTDAHAVSPATVSHQQS